MTRMFDPVSSKLKNQDLREAMLDWSSSSSEEEGEEGEGEEEEGRRIRSIRLWRS